MTKPLTDATLNRIEAVSDANCRLVIADLRATRTALRECADELEMIIEADHSGGNDRNPDEVRSYDRDMEPVRKARACLPEDKR